MTKSILDRNTKAQGTLKSQGDLQIDGQFEGQTMVLGETTVTNTGVQKGTLHSGAARIHGTVHGLLETSGIAEICETGRLNCDVVGPSLIVHPGASIKGRFIITPNSEEREKLKAKYKSPTPESPVCTVSFSIPLEGAKDVKINGSFNRWQEGNAIPCHSNNGAWDAQIHLEPGRYEYVLIVDGESKPDPTNPVKVKNEFGGENSVIELTA